MKLTIKQLDRRLEERLTSMSAQLIQGECDLAQLRSRLDHLLHELDTFRHEMRIEFAQTRRELRPLPKYPPERSSLVDTYIDPQTGMFRGYVGKQSAP